MRVLCLKILAAMLILVTLSIPCLSSGVTSSTNKFSIEFINQHNSITTAELSNELQKGESCWNTPHVQSLVDVHCENLSDEGRARLSMEVLNCYMKVTGLGGFSCPADVDVKECTKNLALIQVAFLAHSTFYAQVDSLCYLLKKEFFEASTERAVNDLFRVTVESTESFKNLYTNLSKGHETLTKHVLYLAEEELRRFQTLDTSVGNVQNSLIDSIAIQNALRVVTDDVLFKQKETLGSINVLSDTQKEEFKKTRDSVHDLQYLAMQALDAVRIAQDSAAADLAKLDENLTHVEEMSRKLESDLEVTYGKLKAQTEVLYNELQQARDNILSVVTEALDNIKHFRLELFLMTSYIYYPLIFLIIISATSIPRTSQSRGSLLFLLVLSLFLERILINSIDMNHETRQMFYVTIRYLFGACKFLVIIYQSVLVYQNPNNRLYQIERGLNEIQRLLILEQYIHHQSQLSSVPQKDVTNEEQQLFIDAKQKREDLLKRLFVVTHEPANSWAGIQRICTQLKGKCNKEVKYYYSELFVHNKGQVPKEILQEEIKNIEKETTQEIRKEDVVETTISAISMIRRSRSRSRPRE